MGEEEGGRWVRCERLGEMPIGGRLEQGGAAQTPPALGQGMLKHVRIEGIDGVEFMCFTDAHPEQDHLFRVGARTLKVAWNEFRLAGRRWFPAEDIERH